MSEKQLLALLKKLPSFKGLSEDTLNDLIKNSEVLNYTPGQPISISGKIGSNIFILLNGQARLLSSNRKDSTTFAKYQAGSLIGITSLLRGQGCEETCSSSELQVLAIKTEFIKDLYLNQVTFSDLSNNYLDVSESLDISQRLISKSPRSDIDIKTAFLQIHKQSQVSTVKNGEKIIVNDDKIIIAASANIENKVISDKISNNEIIICREPFPARIITIPSDLYSEFNSIKDTNNNNQQIANAQKAGPIIPESSNIDVGQFFNKREFKLIRAHGNLQESMACIKMLFDALDMPFRKDNIEKILRSELRNGKPAALELYGAIASLSDLSATGVRVSPSAGTRLQTPSLIKWKDSFSLLRSSNSDGLIIASPKEGLIEINAKDIPDQFEEGIDLLLIEKKNTSPEKKFGIGWFLPALSKYKVILFQVLVASFVVQLFGLANPLLIQVIIDKVISQRSLATLEVLGIALIVVTILGGILGSLRTFLFAETTNRIDTRLGAEVIDHLLRLPLNYFDKRPVGELGTRIAELEKIRNFLTGQALTTILDAIFSIIYIIVMVIYSWLLTFIALGVVPIQIILTLLGAPLIRRQIREAAQENAKTQSHLVEVLTGVQTVKAQNVEIVSRWKWQDLYHKYISKTFERTVTGTALSEISKVLQNLSQLLVLWIGAGLVLNGQLTLGQLIAFRIISSYVTQPLLRLSNIWQEIQQLKVSFERLADIIDTPEESNEFDKSNIPMPTIKGNVSFEDVTFSFDKNKQNVIKNLSYNIPIGKFVGIVGQSGSGKSTLMKLLPRLYELKEGRILIDGYDISKTELYSLRRQVGIVPQEPLLFSGSVSDNIALTDPNADSDEIIKASKIADSHEFIMNLPMGYSTNVGERGAALSGGQKQRIAIARTLLNKPQLLIMDEATSALDYSTERRVCDNLKEFCIGSTVFFITHRLTTIKNADIILMLDKGCLVESGSHNELMQMKGRYYALYNQQGDN